MKFCYTLLTTIAILSLDVQNAPVTTLLQKRGFIKGVVNYFNETVNDIENAIDDPFQAAHNIGFAVRNPATVVSNVIDEKKGSCQEDKAQCAGETVAMVGTMALTAGAGPLASAAGASASAASAIAATAHAASAAKKVSTVDRWSQDAQDTLTGGDNSTTITNQTPDKNQTAQEVSMTTTSTDVGDEQTEPKKDVVDDTKTGNPLWDYSFPGILIAAAKDIKDVVFDGEKK